MRLCLTVALFGATLLALGCGGGGGGSIGSSSGGSSSTTRVDGFCSEITVDRCLRGTFTDTLDTDTEHRWNCAGSGGGTTAMCVIEKSEICPDGAPAADFPLICKRGKHAINGIDRIPLDQVKATNKDMQKMFVIVDSYDGHLESVGAIACDSYVTQPDQCADPYNRTRITRHVEGDISSTTGSAPFTELLDLATDSDWFKQEIKTMGTVKIVSRITRGDKAKVTIGFPHLLIYSAGNEGHNYSWPEEFWTPEQQEAIADEIAADRLLFVAGLAGDENNVIHRRHTSSSSCKDVDDGCLWTRFVFNSRLGHIGTSFSAPNVASALASVLSVFPDTSHQDLVRLARACAKKTGEGIDGPNGLLATSGGFGVADFSCMDEIVAVAADLSEGETAILTVDGREVTVSPRALAVDEDAVLRDLGRSVDRNKRAETRRGGTDR